MWFTRWLRKAQANLTKQRPQRRRRAACSAAQPFRPCLENLEDRRLLSAGMLDPSFGSNGAVLTAFGGADARLAAIAVEPDNGAIVAVGTIYQGEQGSALVVARYHSDGSLDTTFGPAHTGYLTLDFGSTMNRAAAVAVLDDGSSDDGDIFVAGTSYQGNTNDFAVARLDPTGNLVQSFGTNGTAFVDFSSLVGSTSDNVAGFVALYQSDIVVAGTSNTSSVAEARLDMQGNPDNSFGVNGQSVQDMVFFPGSTHFGNGSTPPAISFAMQADGSLLVAGVRIVSSGPAALGYPTSDYPVVGRLTPSGTIDDSFGQLGVAAFAPFTGSVVTGGAFIGESGGATSVAVQPDGGIIVAGPYDNDTILSLPPGVQGQPGLVQTTNTPGIFFGRLLADGSIDSSFNGGGTKIIPTLNSAASTFPMLTATPGGKIIAIDNHFSVLELTRNGSIDSTFGNAGWQTITALRGASQSYSGYLNVQPNGKIVVAGCSSSSGSGNEFALCRLLGDNTSATLTSSDNPSVYGNLVTFTAAVTSSDGVPEGTVDLFDGPNEIDSTSLVDGVAQFTVFMQGGNHSLFVNYEGTSGFSSTGAFLTQTITPSPTETDLAASDNNPTYGHSLTFNATVTSPLDSVGGQVLFLDGNTVIDSETLVSGSAQFTTATLPAGPHSITAEFLDNYSDFATSTSATLTATVEKADQTITFETPADRGYDNSPTTLSAAASSGLSVSFAVLSGPATVSGNTLTVTGVGTVVVEASQAGDGNFNAAPVVDESFNVSFPPVHPAPLSGALDPSFGTGGKISLSFPTSAPYSVIYSAPTAVAVNGKIVVAGIVDPNSSPYSLPAPYSYGTADFAVARYNLDGTPDTTFGNGGTQTIDFGDVNGSDPDPSVDSSDDIATGVAIQSDGSVVVVGVSTIYELGSLSVSYLAAARLTPSGLLDPNFGTGGKEILYWTANYNGNLFATGVALQSDGSVVLTGQTYGTAFATRLTPAGGFDPSFGDRGIKYLGNGDITGIAVAPDGPYRDSIVLADGPAVLRLTPTGQLDPNFGYDGIQYFESWTTGALAVQPDGSIVGGDWSPAVFRLTSGGQLDPNFGNGGTQSIDFGASAMVLGSDGSIVVAGISTTATNLALTRLTSAGQFDSDFGSGGTVTADLGLQNSGVWSLPVPLSLAVQADGNIVLSSDIEAARYLGTGITTSAALTASANPSVQGQDVTFTATVSADAGTPSGSVALFDGSTLLDAEPLVGGTAQFTVSGLAAGDHAITAVYTGGSGFPASSSSTLNQTILDPFTHDGLEQSIDAHPTPDQNTGNPTITLQGNTQTQADEFVASFQNPNTPGFTPLAPPAGAGTPTDIVVTFSPNVQLSEASLVIPSGIRVQINGGIWLGGSPALTFSSGDLTITGATFINSTNAPTILVTGGNLTLRDDVVQESTGYNQAAIQVTSGTVDLGTAADPGGNTLNVNGTGTFILNTTPNPISAVGDQFEVNGSAVFAVLNTGDNGGVDPAPFAGTGTLRQAILDANATPGMDTIVFDISGNGVQTIQPLSALPTITDSVIIDGYTQPGTSPNTLAQGDNAILAINLDGSDAGASAVGLDINAPQSVVRGLDVTNWNGYGIWLDLNSSNSTVAGNFLGTDVSGEVAMPNGSGPRVQNNTSNAAIVVNSGNNEIGGADAASRNIISGNNGVGINIQDSYVTYASEPPGIVFGNIVQGNFIGTDATGTVSLGNTSGILDLGSRDLVGTNADGVADAAERNIISGNTAFGIGLSGANNVVAGNYIGTDVTGTKALGNQSSGVFINGVSETIGGTPLAARNIISSNDYSAGVSDFGSSTVIEGNFIGTDVTGTVALGNLDDGVYERGTGSVIGGTTPGAGNLISGNGEAGIRLEGGGTNGTVVEGNLVGTDFTGNASLANNGWGSIYVSGGLTNVTIGGTTATARNVVAGAVSIYGRTNSGFVIQGNYLGVGADGATPLGGSISIGNGASNILIGGRSPGAGNVIAYGDVGVNINHYSLAPDATGITIVGNSIFGHSGLGIDITRDPAGNDPDGPNPNIPGGSTTGNNHLQNYPVLSSAQAGSSTRIRGTLNSAPNTTFTLDFYANTVMNSSGYGEGKRYLGWATVITDAGGNAAFDVTLAAATTGGEFVAATATDPNGNTSEFSQDILLPVNSPPTARAGGPYHITYGQALQLDGSASSDPDGDALTYSWTINGHANAASGMNPTLTWAQLAALGVGAGPVSVGLLVDDGHGFTDTAQTAITVSQATPTVAVVDGGGIYNGSAFPASATAAGISGVPAGSLEGVNLTPTYYVGTIASGTALGGPPSSAGTYSVLASFPGSADYTRGSATATFTIATALLTVTANSASTSYGQANPPLTYTITGFVPGDSASVVRGSPSLSTAAGTSSPPGTYPIIVGLGTLAANNYSFAFVNGTLTVTYNIGLLLLDPTGKGSLSISGNASLVSQHSESVVVDSSNAGAVALSGNGSGTASVFNFASHGYQTTGSAALHGAVDTAVAALADPLAALPVPAVPAARFGAVKAAGNAVLALQPGTYVGGISVSGNASVTLLPGIYYLQGGGLSVSGNGSLTGTGVLIYNAPQSNSDGITISGQGRVRLSAATNGTYAGITFFQDRASAAPIVVSGSSEFSLGGMFYAARAAVTVTGNGAIDDPWDLVLQMIAYDLVVSGNGQAVVG